MRIEVAKEYVLDTSQMWLSISDASLGCIYISTIGDLSDGGIIPIDSLTDFEDMTTGQALAHITVLSSLITRLIDNMKLNNE